MDEYLESINMAARLLAAADGIEPDRPSHLLMNEADLRGLLEAAGLGAAGDQRGSAPCVPRARSREGHRATNTWAPASRCAQCGGRLARGSSTACRRPIWVSSRNLA